MIDTDLPFTKEDYGNLRDMMQVVKNMDAKLDNLSMAIQTCQANCSDRREKVSKRISVLEDFRTQVLAYAVTLSVLITIAGNWIFTHFFGGT